MINLVLLIWFPTLFQLAPQSSAPPGSGEKPLEKSAFFAFVDRDYIFTIEGVKPGVFLLNFVSMADQDVSLMAKNIRLTLENRKEPGKLLTIETGDVKQPMSVSSLAIHPRSSFGLKLDGDFGNVKEIFGAMIRLGNEDLKLEPLTSFDFESLVTKVNGINLGSPDFSDDWRVLNLRRIGERQPARR
jgi:hypothetical protein